MHYDLLLFLSSSISVVGCVHKHYPCKCKSDARLGGFERPDMCQLHSAITKCCCFVDGIRDIQWDIYENCLAQEIWIRFDEETFKFHFSALNKM